MFKTVSDVVKKNLCTGCGTCYSLCPNESINIVIDKKGIYTPQINEKCNECSICLKVCPGHEFDFKKYNQEIFGKLPNDLLGNFLTCHIGYSNDNDIRYNSSSGGIVTQILISALDEGIIDGALVTRMKKDDPFMPEPFIAKSKEEIIESSKSIYCPVPANIALKSILKSKNKKIAVVGLPCHIQGIRKAESINKRLKEKIVLHIGIFCSTVPNFLATKFLLHKYGLNMEDVKSINYRGSGWPGFLNIKLEKNEISIPMHEYRSSGFAEYFTHIRCKLCVDMCNESADISVADAWLPEIIKRDKIGTSIFLVRNKISKKIFNEMGLVNSIYSIKIEPNDVIKSQNYLIQKKSAYKIFSILNRSSPNYNTTIINPKLGLYIDSLSYLSGRIFASKSYLWNLLIFYKNVKKILFSGRITDYVRKLNFIK